MSIPDANDRKAWDDSFLINSWNEQVAEYEKYHSIAKSGKRLEDVLTEEELKALREDHGNLIAERAATPGADEQHVDDSDAMDLESPRSKMNGSDDQAHQTQPQELVAPEAAQAQQTPAGHVVAEGNALAAAMPQALLGSVQDENLKNMIVSWYWTGYYTGLATGQQAPTGAAPTQ